jgi:CheY-like chemotaxis protein
MCILVVEDDSLIRMILVEELQDAGFDVREAITGDQAIELMGALDHPLQVLVTDINMPGTRNGIELARHVRALMPGVPVIYTTGRPDALQEVNQLGEREFLIRKPYVPDEVIGRVLQLMAG